jgi:hypothetical protein
MQQLFERPSVVVKSGLLAESDGTTRANYHGLLAEQNK